MRALLSNCSDRLGSSRLFCSTPIQLRPIGKFKQTTRCCSSQDRATTLGRIAGFRDGAQPVERHRRQLLCFTGSLLLSPLLMPVPALCTTDDPRPAGYLKNASQLVDKLLESLQMEEDGAGEYEVRRKGDEVKPLVREFVSRWKDDKRLEGDVARSEIQEAIKELADFYMKNGQRKGIPRDIIASVRQHLIVAQETLPEQESRLGFLGL
mmetsp:Transcript_32378/g.76871  ORF Transcript_32378/g.76871 Transcript_32378/m.76871 type:complete len:209 (+) Transcript_32378:103-729(+)